MKSHDKLRHPGVLYVKLDPEMMRNLRQLAQRNERSITAEVRIALKAHLGLTGNGKRARQE